MATAPAPASSPEGRIQFGLLVLLIASSAFSVALNSIALVLLLLHWLFMGAGPFTKLKRFYAHPLFWPLVLFPAMLLLSLAWSTPGPNFERQLTLNLTLLLLPLLLLTGPSWSFQKLGRLMLFAAAIFSLALIVALGIAAWRYRLTPEPNLFLSHTLVRPIDGQSFTYSRWLVSALLFALLYRIQVGPLPLPRWLQVFWLGFILLGLFLLSNKIQLLLLAFFAGLGVLLYYHQQGLFKRGLLLATIGLVVFLGLILAVPYSRARFLRVLKPDLSILTAEQIRYEDYPVNEFNSRLFIWREGLQLAQENPVVGLGAGDMQPALTQAYRNAGLPRVFYQFTGYGSHNQFLSAFLMAGVLGLASLLLLYFAPLRYAFRHKLWFLVIVVGNVVVSSMFEATISGHYGLQFFSLLLCLTLLTQARPAQPAAPPRTAQ